MTGPNKERNHTSHTGRRSMRTQRVHAAPDSLIKELESIMAEGGFAHVNTADQFLNEGFSDKDLVICPELSTSDVSVAWLREVLKWNPNASAGEPGAWTLAPPAPSIADRLGVYLYVLQVEREQVDTIFHPGAHASAQRGLNELLLEHPILMHPRIRMNAWVLGGRAGTCSVAHAIALNANARFPMVSDWPEGQAPLERLAKFADLPVVRCGLTFKSLPHEGECVQAKGYSMLEAAVKLKSAQPGLLASLFDLGRQATLQYPDPTHGPKPKLGIFLDDWKKMLQSWSSINRYGILADSFIEACGVIGPGLSTMDIARKHRNEAFFDYLRAHTSDELVSILHQVRWRVFEGIFGRGGPSYNPDEVDYNLRAIVTGMTKVGLFGGRAEGAANWILRQLTDVGILRQLTNVGIPAVDAPSALGFIRSMREYGAQVEVTHFSTNMAHESLDELAERAPGWAAALRVDATERGMNEIIGMDSPQAGSRGRRRLRSGL
jgi:hypothetical protein